jgi:hypothetical protein
MCKKSRHKFLATFDCSCYNSIRLGPESQACCCKGFRHLRGCVSLIRPSKPRRPVGVHHRHHVKNFRHHPPARRSGRAGLDPPLRPHADLVLRIIIRQAPVPALFRAPVSRLRDHRGLERHPRIAEDRRHGRRLRGQCGTHNLNGHLGSLISAPMCAVAPNFKVMEIDIDDVSWKDDIVTMPPVIKEGELMLGRRRRRGIRPLPHQNGSNRRAPRPARPFPDDCDRKVWAPRAGSR